MSTSASALRIGVDLGGTKIEAIALGADGSPLQRRRVPTPRGDYAATLRAIVTLVHHLERDLGQGASVGVGIPGALSTRTARVKNANSTWLIGKALDDDLATLLGRPVRVSNDANCFALSEASDGAGAGSQVVFGVIIGTGTGGGLVINGHVLTGLNAIAGEWGHNPLPWPDENELPGPPCYCGKRGCIETFLSGPGLTGDHHAHGGHGDDPMAINALAERGDPLAEASLRRYERRLAKALATVINILDPDVIVLGGGVSNLQRLYRNVPQLWCEYVFSDVVDTLLVPAKHGDSSGVRGAAWLWE